MADLTPHQTPASTASVRGVQAGQLAEHERIQDQGVPRGTMQWRSALGVDGKHQEFEFAFRYLFALDPNRTFGLGLKGGLLGTPIPDGGNRATLGGGVVAEQVLIRGQSITLSLYEDVTMYADTETRYAVGAGVMLHINRFLTPSLRPVIGMGGLMAFNGDVQRNGIGVMAGLTFR